MPSSKFLHDRPDPGETNPLTCILANGSRVFLRRRKNDSFKEDNDCNTTSSRFDKSSSKNLLGKSMKELLDEADKRKKNQLVSQFSKENYDADLITENDPNLFCPGGSFIKNLCLCLCFFFNTPSFFIIYIYF